MQAICLLVAALFFCAATAASANQTAPQAAAVSIDPGSFYSVNGVIDIQPVRAMVVNGGSNGQRVAEAAALHMSGARLYLWADIDAADEPKELSNYNLGLPDRIGWLLGHDMDSFVRDQFDRHLKVDDWMSSQYRQLDYLGRWNATRNVVLHITQPHPRDENDFAAYARYFRAMLCEVKRRYPNLDVRYVMLYNEPNISYVGPDDRRDRAKRIALLYSLDRVLMADLRKELPSVTVVAPSLSQFYRWSDWNDWVVPFLEQVPDAACFGVQIYAARFDELLAWNDMLQAKSLGMNGHRVPLVITEWNPQAADAGSLPGGAEYWRDCNEVSRVQLLASGLFGMMEHPDKFAFNSYFIYDYGHDGYDLLQAHDGTVGPTAGYMLYRALRDVAGSRVYASSTDPALQVITSVDGARLIVALHNSASAAKSIDLDLSSVRDSAMRHVRLDSLSYDSVGRKFDFASNALGLWPKSLALPPGGVAVLSGELPPRFSPRKTLVEREFFSTGTKIDVTGSDVEMMLPSVKTSALEDVFLRLGVYCDNIRSIGKIDFELNGHALSAPFLPDDREKRPRSVLYFEQGIDARWLGAHNRVVFRPAPGCSYRVMFALIGIKPHGSSSARH